jgi:hypothetical protein
MRQVYTYICRECGPGVYCKKVTKQHRNVFIDLSASEKHHCMSRRSKGEPIANFVLEGEIPYGLYLGNGTLLQLNSVERAAINYTGRL